MIIPNLLEKKAVAILVPSSTRMELLEREQQLSHRRRYTQRSLMIY